MRETASNQSHRTADPFLAGDLAGDQIAHDYPITQGLHFPDPAPSVLLLRRKVYPGDVEDWYYAGATHDTESTIQNWDGITHEVSSGYEYVAARCFPNGFVGEVSEPVRVDFDGDGSIITPALPTWPESLEVTPTAGGKFMLTWRYYGWGQGSAPTDFQIFRGATVAGIDYDSVVATVAYDPSSETQSHETGAYGDGTPHAWAVRARNSGGVKELNELTTGVKRAEAGTPTAAIIDSAAVENPTG